MADKKKWKTNGDGSVTITLAYPIQLKDKIVDSVTLRGEVTVEDLEVMDKGKGEVAKSIYMIAELSGLSPGVIRKMKSADFGAVADALAHVMGDEGNDPPKTGETS